jgi:hypothetical protein
LKVISECLRWKMTAEESKENLWSWTFKRKSIIIWLSYSDPDGFVYFNELLYKTMKRRYMPGRTKKKILFECELDTLDKLEKIMNE